MNMIRTNLTISVTVFSRTDKVYVPEEYGSVEPSTTHFVDLIEVRHGVEEMGSSLAYLQGRCNEDGNFIFSARSHQRIIGALPRLVGMTRAIAAVVAANISISK